MSPETYFERSNHLIYLALAFAFSISAGPLIYDKLVKYPQPMQEVVENERDRTNNPLEKTISGVKDKR